MSMVQQQVQRVSCVRATCDRKTHWLQVQVPWVSRGIRSVRCEEGAREKMQRVWSRNSAVNNPPLHGDSLVKIRHVRSTLSTSDPENSEMMYDANHFEISTTIVQTQNWLDIFSRYRQHAYGQTPCSVIYLS